MTTNSLVSQGEKRRAQILGFIKRFVKKHGYSPSISEICDAVGVASPNAVRNHLLKMQEEGVIDLTPRVARSIVLKE